ncbi:alpha/beta-hydrolase [Aaosphaeria arxii CBS 175.79]|uniref:Alpha/beta-hydrolase n=1 Tax=Aaosphaeria arxii CBS 175.79 TaxID=1450172 RepID=A0A6A5X6I3_9PLEO|nr:alpha/beta-hydrolase [Aaosphaeria arxii CBS 175.79]KAF2008529.1 alpha/beta-hydrolase [Aaosphaeria arxii CBS 175.79]
MALQYLSAKLSVLPRLFSPTTTFLFAPSSVPFTLRWRLLFMQPINLLAALLTSPQWLFNNRYSVLYAPTRSPGASQRCLVYHPPTNNSKAKKPKPPLHINIHGGGWIGGIAEQDSRFCAHLSDATAAIVVSISYRTAPRWRFPAAHEDVEDVVRWVLGHAAREWDVDLGAVTVGGSSVGGTLALGLGKRVTLASSSLRDGGDDEEGIDIKGCVLVCPLLDSRPKTVEREKPPGFPAKDPLDFLYPLFDAYGEFERREGGAVEGAALSPMLMRAEDLPARLMVVVAGVDILAKEQLEFVRRVEGEIEECRVMVFEKGFHGFMELPKFVMEKERIEVFTEAVDFIKRARRSS